LATPRYHSKWTMKIATWKINSVRRRLSPVVDWLTADRPDLLWFTISRSNGSEDVPLIFSIAQVVLFLAWAEVHFNFSCRPV